MGTLKKYDRAWPWELSALAKDSGFECVDRLLMVESVPNPNLTQTQKPYQLFTHTSVVAFTTMGMVRPITLTSMGRTLPASLSLGIGASSTPMLYGVPALGLRAWRACKMLITSNMSSNSSKGLVEPSIGTPLLSHHHLSSL